VIDKSFGITVKKASEKEVETCVLVIVWVGSAVPKKWKWGCSGSSNLGGFSPQILKSTISRTVAAVCIFILYLRIFGGQKESCVIHDCLRRALCLY
jgi:hypothetical protein